VSFDSGQAAPTGGSPGKRLADKVPHQDAVRLLEAGSLRLRRLKARRKLWLEIHLWLGLTAGAALVLIGLSGSVLVFWQAFDGWLNPSLYYVAPGAQALPLERLGEAAKAWLPKAAEIGWVEFPRHPDESLSLSYALPSAAVPGGADAWNLFLDPYTAQVQGARIWYPADWFSGMPAMAFMFKLHYALLMKDWGVPVVGVIAVFLLFSVLTGLIVWWPLTGKWRQALTLKRRASAERLNFDLHKTAGFYTSLVMLAVLLSGIYMNLPDYFNALVGVFSPVTVPEQFHSQPAQGREPIGWARAAAIVDAAYPEGQLASLSPVSGATGVYQVCKRDVASLNRFVGSRCALVDRYSGDILKVIDPASGTAGDVFLQWQWPLHSGQAFGWTGRILVFLAGLACPLLYATGVIRWLQKRRASRRQPPSTSLA